MGGGATTERLAFQNVPSPLFQSLHIRDAIITINIVHMGDYLGIGDPPFQGKIASLFSRIKLPIPKIQIPLSDQIEQRSHPHFCKRIILACKKLFNKNYL